jgi:DNA repair protein RecN (Recombination protein N)
MLETLSIKNFIIVDYLELNFQKGFTALTGETGAGKSILIDALSICLGQKS